VSKGIRERVSDTLNIKYVTLNDSYMTEDGVLLMKSECKGIQSSKLLKLYNDKLADGVLYDYIYAKSTGAKRRKRYTANDTFVRIEELREKNNSDMVENSCVIVALRVLMLAVGVMSTVVTGVNLNNALSQSLDSGVAFLFAIAMAIFLTGSFESFIIFKRKRMYGLATIIVVCFAVTVTYSITAEMEVMYRGYASREVTRHNSRQDADRDALASSLIVDDFDNDIQNAEDRLAIAIAEYKRYVALDSVATWRVSEMQNKIDQYTKALNSLRTEKRAVISSNKDVVTVKTKEEEAESFFDFIEETFGVSARKIRFFRDMLPALFIDFISPISVSVAMFMGVNNGKRKRKEEDSGSSGEGEGEENTNSTRVCGAVVNGSGAVTVPLRERIDVSRIFGAKGGKGNVTIRSGTQGIPEQETRKVQHTGSVRDTDDIGEVTNGI
jgi:hypothetical protein